jgi:hypothetical protein
MRLLNFVPAFLWSNESQTQENLSLEPRIFLDYPENGDTQLLRKFVSIFLFNLVCYYRRLRTDVTTSNLEFVISVIQRPSLTFS